MAKKPKTTKKKPQRASLSQHTTLYRPENAYWMARLAGLVYEKRADGSPDTAAILAALQKEDGGFREVVGFDKSSAQSVVVRHDAFIVAAFRGTDELGDWFDNVNALAADFPFGRVHRGFLGALHDVWPEMREQYVWWQKGYDGRPPSKRAGNGGAKPKQVRDAGLPLWLTGHSLGGAMATLAAAELVHADEAFYGLYTFGSPRVGDRDFARVFNVEARSRMYRFQNNNDIVTRVPARVMGYSHVGSFVYISEDGDLSADSGWWYRFLDRVGGAVRDLGELGLDGVDDHNMTHYARAIDEWGTKAIPGLAA